MRSYVVISSMGPDRPGLAKEIAEFFTARGINIERSPRCVLGNEFGMIILTSGKTDDIERLIKDLDSLREKTKLENLRSKNQSAQPSRRIAVDSLQAHCQRPLINPGIIHQICKSLQLRGVSIETYPPTWIIIPLRERMYSIWPAYFFLCRRFENYRP